MAEDTIELPAIITIEPVPGPSYEHPAYEPTPFEQALLDALPATEAQLVTQHEEEHHPGEHTNMTMARYVSTCINRLAIYDLAWRGQVGGELGWVRGDGKPRTSV